MTFRFDVRLDGGVNATRTHTGIRVGKGHLVSGHGRESQRQVSRLATPVPH